MDHHSYASRLTSGAALEDLDVSDHVRAPVGVTVNRGEQGKALLERCVHDRCGFSVKFSWTQCLPLLETLRAAGHPSASHVTVCEQLEVTAPR
jgi:hypothetical protein